MAANAAPPANTVFCAHPDSDGLQRVSTVSVAYRRYQCPARMGAMCRGRSESVASQPGGTGATGPARRRSPGPRSAASSTSRSPTCTRRMAIRTPLCPSRRVIAGRETPLRTGWLATVCRLSHASIPPPGTIRPAGAACGPRRPAPHYRPAATRLPMAATDAWADSTAPSCQPGRAVV